MRVDLKPVGFYLALDGAAVSRLPSAELLDAQCAYSLGLAADGRLVVCEVQGRDSASAYLRAVDAADRAYWRRARRSA